MSRSILLLILVAGAPRPTQGDKEAAAAAAQDAAQRLARAQARANEAIKACPAADAPVSPEDLTAMGDALLADRKLTLVAAPAPKAAFVDELGKRLAKKSARPDAAWAFSVFESEAVETASFPPARVAISTGALKAAENEAQLAALLGHELGHLLDGSFERQIASMRHNLCVPLATVKAYEAEGMADSLPRGIGGAGSAATLDAMARDTMKMRLMMGAGRAAELDADRVAFELLVAGGYETRELEKAIDRAGTIANHPPATERNKAIAELRAKANPPKGKAPPLPKNLK